ncbi:alpha/beta hydrolase [Chitinophaga silvatica]|uniref:Alpha/beta hydrolase n=1 Tax=Chitinophaga silvatica TaxID=2282649 RepID=A0A3E1Y461_9BACT|nr:alpha/beta hydrolase [Chitinophaga silvatica]RFS19461.1 alpha/beta hydrolase [Chitinophaga silvatica]
MQQKAITINNISLSYYEQNEGADKTIFFVHGNSGSGKAWIRQFQGSHLSEYRLIAFDLPAHGQSASLDGSIFNYNFPDFGKLLNAAVNLLNRDKPYILAGVSIGTNIVTESLAHGLKPEGIVLVGPCVLGGAYTVDKVVHEDPLIGIGFMDEISEAELHGYSQLGFFSKEEENWKAFATDFSKVTDGFRAKIATSFMAGDYSDEIKLLEEQPALLLVIFGEHERVCRINYLDDVRLNLWKEQIHKIPLAGHFVQADQPLVFNKMLADFAEEVFK